MSKPTQGIFYGLGTGPGPYGLLPVAALEILQKVDLIYAPRSRVSKSSVALEALQGLEFDRQKVREVEFLMDGNDQRLGQYYNNLAKEIADLLRQGQSIAYLTIGDAMTYSTLGYLVAALKREDNSLARRIFPGVTSYTTAAAMTEFSLGEGKERMLILPCPDDVSSLAEDIQRNDVVILMKVGKRFEAVLDVLHQLDITEHCALAHRLGLDGEIILPTLEHIPEAEKLGYLSVLLIRKGPPGRFE